MTSDNSDSARACLIKTRRGTWIDKSLLPSARRECLEVLCEAAEAVGEDVVKMARGDTRHLNEEQLASNRYHLWGYHTPVRDALGALRKELFKYQPPEEEKARELAHKARESARMCGCCGREFVSREPAYFGAEVYVSMMPLDWNKVSKPRICEPQYERTVLCESCAPEWLSPDRDDVVTQLCANCERPMVSRLALSELRRTLCSDPCRRAYQNQVRKERRAEEGKKSCEVCGEEFTATRRDSKTCSDSCRQKAYRRRRKEAQQDR